MASGMPIVTDGVTHKVLVIVLGSLPYRRTESLYKNNGSSWSIQ